MAKLPAQASAQTLDCAHTAFSMECNNLNNSIINTAYQEAVPSLMTELGLKSPMAVPKISKVTLNMGLGAEAINDRKVIENAMEDLKLISGQQPIKTNARKCFISSCF